MPVTLAAEDRLRVHVRSTKHLVKPSITAILSWIGEYATIEEALQIDERDAGPADPAKPQ